MSYENDPNNQPTKAGERAKKFFKHVWDYLKAAKMEYIVLASFFVADMISKGLVAGLMYEGQSVAVIPYVLHFTYSQNDNAAFGATWFTDFMGDIGARIAFCVFAVAASAVFMIIMYKNKGGNKIYRAGLAMLTAGALGNMIDRMFLGYVRDFIDFVCLHPIKWTYIFNIADSALVVGVILVIVYFLFLYDTEGRKARKAAKLAKKAAELGEASAPAEPVADEAHAENTDNASDAQSEDDSGEDMRTQAPITDGVESDATEPAEPKSEQTPDTKTEKASDDGKNTEGDA